MKRLWLFCMLLLLGTAVQAQEVEKEIIYTLSESEVLATNESNLHLYLSKLGYVAVIDNRQEKNRKYIINRGIYGPFERRSIAPPTLTERHWCFTDTQKDSNVVIFDGYKVYKHPASQRTFDARITDYLQSYIMYNERLSEYNIQVNGRSQGPFPNLIDYHLSNYGDSWAVVFFENDGNRYDYYVQFSNGNVIGPFEAIYQFVFLDINQWILMAKKFNTEPIIASGIDELSMEETEELVERYSIITDKGDLGLFERKLVGDYDYEQYNRVAYTTHNYAVNVIKDQKIYYLVNGQLFGPYEDFVKQYDLGIKPERFNYVVGAEQTLYFRGRKGFSSNVQYFKVSDSRNSVAIVKPNLDTGKDSLVINEKYYVGDFYSILNIQFIPGTEDFYFWNMSETAFDAHQLHAYIDGKVEYMGEYAILIDVFTGYPKVYFSPSKKHWAFVYQDLNTQEYKMVIDGIEYPAGILPKVVVYKDNDGAEYAAWLDLEGNNLILNKLKFQN